MKHDKPFFDLTPKPADRIEELTIAVENIERGQMVILSKLDTVIIMLEQILQRNKITH